MTKNELSPCAAVSTVAAEAPLSRLLRFGASIVGSLLGACRSISTSLLLFLFLFVLTQGTSRAQIIFFGTGLADFSAPTYTINEAGGSVTITITAQFDPIFSTNGIIFGDFMTVDYTTDDGVGTAIPGADYIPISGTAVLQSGFGGTNLFTGTDTFNITILDNGFTNAPRTIALRLSNPQNGELGGLIPTAVVEIQDNEGTGEVSPAGTFQFSKANYITSHAEAVLDDADQSQPGVLLTVTRNAGSVGRVLLDFATTTNGPPLSFTNIFDLTNLITFGYTDNARPFADFLPTNGTIVFDDFQMSATFLVRIVKRIFDEVPTDGGGAFGGTFFGDIYPTNYFNPAHWLFNVNLSNLRADPQEDPALIKPIFGRNTSATVDIRDVQVGFNLIRYRSQFSETQPVVEPASRDPIPNSNPPNLDPVKDQRQARLWVRRSGPLSDGVTVRYNVDPTLFSNGGGTLKDNGFETDAGNEYATPYADFLPPLTGIWREFVGPDTAVPNTLNWGATEVGWKPAVIPIINDDRVEFSEDMFLRLWQDVGDTGIMGVNRNAHVNILADQFQGMRVNNGYVEIGEQPAGAADRTFNPANQEQTDPPNNTLPGANNTVHATLVQPSDGKVVIGGDFTKVNTISRAGIARLNADGSLDTTFQPGTGADGTVSALVLQSLDSKIIVAGQFRSINGVGRLGIARLLPDGTLDPSFDPGLGIDNDSAINAAVIDDQQRIYIGGTFSSYGGTNRAGIARLLPSGLLDTSFDPGQGFNGSVYSIALTPGDSRPVVGGQFTEFAGANRSGVARLNLNGVVDPTFNPGTGVDGIVYSVALQGDSIIIAGDFTTVDFRSRNGIAKLNANGSLNTAFSPGSGFDKTVYSIAIQPDGKPVLGGLFTSFNGNRRLGMARLNYDGSLDTSFMDTAYNQFAGLPNRLSTDNINSQENFVRSITHYRTNINFVGTNFVRQTASLNIFTNSVSNDITLDYFYIGGRFRRVGGGTNRDDVLSQSYIARVIGGQTPGPGNLSFDRDQYFADEDAGTTFVTLRRENGSLAAAAVGIATVASPSGPGSATEGLDFTQLLSSAAYPSTYTGKENGTRQVSDALSGPSNDEVFTGNQEFNGPLRSGPFNQKTSANNFNVKITDDLIHEGDESVNLVLFSAQGSLTLGGEPIPVGFALGRSTATLTIADNDFDFGTLAFASTEYTVKEDGLNAIITVVREGGSSGTVAVDYSTKDGTATQGKANVGGDYDKATGTLTFGPGVVQKSFNVRINDDTKAELDETINLFLVNPTGFPTNTPQSLRINPTRAQALLTILDNDFLPGRISFQRSTYTNSESAQFATIVVERTGGVLGDLRVDYATVDGSALAGRDYLPISGTLAWAAGDITSRTLTVPLINNLVVDPDRTFQLQLTNAFIDNNANNNALGSRTIVSVRILNDDTPGSFKFSQSNYAIDENAGKIRVTVLRIGGQAGANSVNVTVTNLTAINGIDFTAVATNLLFAAGEVSRSFDIPIIDNNAADGDRTISLLLSRAAPGTILVPSSVLTIIDNELLREPAGSLDPTFTANGVDDFVYSTLLQADGSVVAAGDFRYVNNVVRTGLARLIDDGTLDPIFDIGSGVSGGAIRSMALTLDERIVISGLFTNVAGTNRNYVARLNLDGSVDVSFNPGSGADNPIYSVTVQPDQKVVLGGGFSTFNGFQRSGLVRLQTNGVIDASFDVGTGANGTVYATAIQSDGKIIAGGDFTTFDGSSQFRLVRLNSDGTTDTAFGATNFNSGTGFGGSVRSIAIQSDGMILVGGLFTDFNGAKVGRILRLDSNGNLDPTFNPSVGLTDSRVVWGADGPVNAIAVQIDSRIVVGGDFHRFNGVTRNQLTRLRADGSVDPTINFGFGPNGTVSSLLIQPDRKIVFSGGFTEYNGVPKTRIARVFGGSLDGSGSVQFSKAQFNGSESSTNTLITVVRTGGTTGELKVSIGTRDGSATANLDYVPLDPASPSNVLVFPEGEVATNFVVRIINDNLLESVETVLLQLTNVVSPGTLGFQPTAVINIQSDDSQVSFSQAEYLVNEGIPGGSVFITVVRTGSTLRTESVVFKTVELTNSAKSGIDFQPTTNTITFAAGQVSQTFGIGIIDNLLVQGDHDFGITLTTNGIDGGNSGLRLGIAQSKVIIVDNDFSPGHLGFSEASFKVGESQGEATITVTRKGGTTGVISVDYFTTAGTATAGAAGDYRDVVGILTFADGEVSKSFAVPINDDTAVEGNETVLVGLRNVRGGAILDDPTTVVLTIVDNDLGAGSLDPSFNPTNSLFAPGAMANGTNAAVRAVVRMANGGYLIGGDFTSYNGSNLTRLAQINSDGSVVASFNPGIGPDKGVRAIATLDGGDFLAAGSFNNVNNQLKNRVARFNMDGSLDMGFDLPLGLNGQVSAVAWEEFSNKVLIGGFFDKTSAANRDHLARLNHDGTVDTAFTANVDNNVYSINVLHGTNILVVGAFTTVNGVSSPGIARLKNTGERDSSFMPGAGANGTIYDVYVLQNEYIMVVGDFTQFDGQPRSRIARLMPNGSLDATFTNGSPNSVVYSIDLQDDQKILIGGDFTTVDGVQRNRIARLNADGSLDTTFKTGDGANGTVYAVLYQPADGNVLIAGAFSTADLQPRWGIARINGNMPVQPRILALSPSANGFALSFESQLGISYLVEVSADMADWTAATATIVGTGNVISVPLPSASTVQFYRIKRSRP